MKRLECLDGLRGVLAVYVMLGHMAPFAAMPAGLAHALSHGGAAVDVFFMLSGLVIYGSLEGFGWRSRPFLIARAARIFPVYLAILPVSSLILLIPADFGRLPWIGPESPALGIWATGWPRLGGLHIGAHVIMIHGLLPDAILPDAWVSLLGAAWSLSTEWQFYVLALVLGRLWRGSRDRLDLAFLLIAIAGLAWHMAGPVGWQFGRAFLPNKAHYFALGLASAACVEGRAAAVRRYGWVLMATLAISGFQGGPEKLLPPLVWTLCLSSQLRPNLMLLGAMHHVLRAPILLRLGALSYCIYLANEPIQRLLGVILADAVNGNAALFTLGWLPGAVLLPLLAAVWLHGSIEMPALRFGRAYADDGVQRR
ncbi:MAG: acyltransferase [Acetobacteraceae bacterium]|nr:acyltransferase [Acetobacteraceae bacterium]